MRKSPFDRWFTVKFLQFSMSWYRDNKNRSQFGLTHLALNYEEQPFSTKKVNKKCLVWMSTAASLVSKKKTLKMLPHLPSQLRDLSTKFQQQQKKKIKRFREKNRSERKKKVVLKITLALWCGWSTPFSTPCSCRKKIKNKIPLGQNIKQIDLMGPRL